MQQQKIAPNSTFVQRLEIKEHQINLTALRQKHGCDLLIDSGQFDQDTFYDVCPVLYVHRPEMEEQTDEQVESQFITFAINPTGGCRVQDTDNLDPDEDEVAFLEAIANFMIGYETIPIIVPSN